MEKTTKNLLIGSSVAAAGASALGWASFAATKLLVGVAMDRQQPSIPNLEKRLERLQGHIADEAFLQHLEENAQRLQSLPHEVVHITAADGTDLVGHWFACPNAKRVIVAMHGWRSSWNRDFGTIHDFWQKNGCSVLYAEQRGQGSSGGEYISFGMMERYDCRAWIDWVDRKCEGKLPVYLGGVSMGASTVLMAAGLDLPETVKGIMADCGFTSADAVWRHVAQNNLHMSYRLRGSVASALCKRRIQMGTKDCSTIQAMENCRVPVLFAHGARDHFVPVEMTYENYAACAAPKQLLVVPQADHGMCYYVEPKRYEQMSADFWRFCEQ